MRSIPRGRTVLFGERGELALDARGELLEEERPGPAEQRRDGLHRARPIGRGQRLQHAADVDVDVAKLVVQLARGLRAASVHDAIGDVPWIRVLAGPSDRGGRDVDADHGGEVRGEQARLAPVTAAEVDDR
jgi:hypothetical protein